MLRSRDIEKRSKKPLNKAYTHHIETAELVRDTNEVQNNLKANNAINVRLRDSGKTPFQQGLQLH